MRRRAQWLTMARRMSNGARTGPGGNGWGTGVVVKIQPAPETDVTVEAIKTNCKCSADSGMVVERIGKMAEPGAPPLSRCSGGPKAARPRKAAQMYKP